MNSSVPDLPLRDIHLPDSISWWPPALGWWILLGAGLLLLLFTFILVKAYLKSNLKRDASKELKIIERRFLQTDDAVQCLSALSIFLRRAALSQKHDVMIAGLTGFAWLQFLDRPLGTTEFSQGPGLVLLEGPYQPAVEKDRVTQLLQLCRKWVERL